MKTRYKLTIFVIVLIAIISTVLISNRFDELNNENSRP